MVRTRSQSRGKRWAARVWPAPAACALLLAAVGCQPAGRVEYERELQRLRDALAEKENQVAAQQATIDTLTRRLDEVRAIKPEDLAKLFVPDRLVIDGLSGGYDEDGRPGDDGVVVYLKPVDQVGDVLKVAGDIRIQLYDLAAPPDRNLVGECVIPLEEARNLWYGKLMTYHYAVRCPWRDGPPAHPEITIRATFTDYLTQHVLTAQRTCTVRLPAP